MLLLLLLMLLLLLLLLLPLLLLLLLLYSMRLGDGLQSTARGEPGRKTHKQRDTQTERET